MLFLLTFLSVMLAITYVVVLAVTLILTAYYLLRSARLAEALAGGLEAVDTNTTKLPSYLTTINGALVQLLGGLKSVDGHLLTIARAAGYKE